MIAFIEGGMTIPIGRVTQDFLINHRLTPHQCVPNLFRILGCVDTLNEQMGLRLMWLDVVHMYECHKLSSAGYYLKSQSDIIRLISFLPKSNKGMKDDYLIVSKEQHDGLHCPTQREFQVGYPRISPFGRRFCPFSFIPFSFLTLHLLLTINFISLTMISSSNIFANKRHVAPRLSLVNVPALNYLLGSEIFISEVGGCEPLTQYLTTSLCQGSSRRRVRQSELVIPGQLAQTSLCLVFWLGETFNLSYCRLNEFCLRQQQHQRRRLPLHAHLSRRR